MNEHRNNISLAIISAAILVLSAALVTGNLAVVSRGITAQDPPKITFLPPAGPVHTPTTVTGSGFTAGANVTLSWFGFILDVPGISGHLGYYTIKTGITANNTGGFVTTFKVPFDFSDIPHFVNATQNGAGTGITNATFTVVPTMQLSPKPAIYKDGKQVLLHIWGGPLGTAAFAMKLSPEATVIKLTYDNTLWGFATSHLATEGPIVTGGLVGGDIGGNITIRFRAVGEEGKHDIRGYVGAKDSPPYLPCEIGGEATFSIFNPNS